MLPKIGRKRFFSQLIIITALDSFIFLPESRGKMFSPLAFTLGFALLGESLVFTLTLVPVLSAMLLKKNVREKNNRFLRFVNEKSSRFV